MSHVPCVEPLTDFWPVNMPTQRFSLLACLLPLLGACAATPVTSTSVNGVGHDDAFPSGPALVSRAHERPLSPQIEARVAMIHDLLLGELSGFAGRGREAATLYLDVARRADDPAIAERATQVALFTKDWDLALAACERWMALAPDNVNALATLAVLRIQSGDDEGALAALDGWLAKMPADKQAAAYAQLGQYMSQNSSRARAMAFTSRLVERHPQRVDAWTLRARLAIHYKSAQEFRDSMDAVLERQPKRRDLYQLQAAGLMGLGETEDAMRAMHVALKRFPDDQSLRLTYARMLVDARRLPEASEEFERLLRSRPNDDELRLAAGLVALELGELDRAQNRLKPLLKDPSRADFIRTQLGRIEEKRGRFDQARAYYQAVEDPAQRIDAGIRSAALYRQQKQAAQAREALHQLIPLAQDDGDLQRLLLVEVDWLRDDGHFEEAFFLLGRGVARWPENDDLLFSRAMMAEKLDRIDLLETDLRLLIERNPDNPEVLNALGYTLVDRTDRYQEGLDLIHRALAQDPDNAAYLDSLGWALYRLGRLEDAVEPLKEAYRRMPDGEIAAHLGEVLWQLGRREEALELWRKAEQEQPGHPVLKKTLERLLP